MYYKEGVQRESFGTQKESVHEDGYTRLALGIIQQAVEDMHYAMSMTPPGMSHKKVRNAKRNMRRDCMEFFYSDWFDTIVNGIVHPDKVVSESYRYKAARLNAPVDNPHSWLATLNADHRHSQRKSRKIDMDFCAYTDDKRRKEYEERVKWRKRRLKKGSRKDLKGVSVWQKS